MAKDRWEMEEMRLKYLRSEAAFHREQAKLHMKKADRWEELYYLALDAYVGCVVFIVVLAVVFAIAGL